MKRVFVTGGTGFLGAHLLPRLVEDGYEVHVLARPTARRDHLAGLPLCWHEGDLGDPDSLERALRSAGEGTAVVHGAARISYRSSDQERSEQVNVTGTEHLLRVARATGAARFCFVSSVVAVGQAATPDAALDEDHPFDGHRLGCVYVSTKRAAEERVLAAGEDLDVVVVCPGAIFGPAPEPSNTTKFLRSVARSPIPLPTPPGSLSVVGVEDVADGVVRALERGESGRRYLLTESNWTLAELFRFVRRRLGLRPGPGALPPWCWRVVVSCATTLDRLRPFEVAAPQALRLLGEHYRFDSSRAQRELGWRPAPFEQVLDETVAWMRREGHLA